MPNEVSASAHTLRVHVDKWDASRGEFYTHADSDVKWPEHWGIYTPYQWTEFIKLTLQELHNEDPGEWGSGTYNVTVLAVDYQGNTVRTFADQELVMEAK